MSIERCPGWLAALVRRHGGIVVDRDDGGVVVADRTARCVATIDPPSLRAGEEAVRTQVGELLALGEPADPDGRVQFEVHITLEAIHRSSDVRNSLPPLLEGLLPVGPVELKVYFSRPPRDWYLFANWVGLLLRRHPPLRGRVHLWGPPSPGDELLKETFCDLGLRLGATAGWSPVGPQELQWDAVRDWSRFGFRVPVVFFVTAANLHEVPAVLEASLRANEYSGFALAAAFHHPDYDPTRHDPAPAPADYAALLARTYRDLPQYDDVFFPITDVVSSFADGGWRADARTPATARLLLTPTGGVGTFRHVPGLATGWVDWPTFRTWPPEELPSRLLDIQRTAFAQPDSRPCRDCPWWHVCGGGDRTEGRLSADSVWSAACEYRKEFFAGLLRLRAEFIPLNLPVPGPLVKTGPVLPGA